MLTHNQKIAFTSILIEMANADGMVDPRELGAVKRILEGFSVDDETFMLAKCIPVNIALDVMNGASSADKVTLGLKLVEVIDADEKVDDSEIKLLNHIADRLSLESYFDKK